MFAGIVEQVGTVTAVHRATGDPRAARRVDIRLGELAEDLRPGASVAVNGVCLSVTEARGAVGSFDVVPETLRRSTLGGLRSGSRVNLERSLHVGDRIDGHFVQGHVDAIGTVGRIVRDGSDYRLWTAFDAEIAPYIVEKGSIAIDGVSLTVAEVDDGRFAVALIPTTLERTILGALAHGDPVNLETDLLARLVVNRLDSLVGAAGVNQGISVERLRASGFLP